MTNDAPDQSTRLVAALRALHGELAGINRVVAGRLGINDSDLAVLDLLHREGPQTPTALARRTRLGPTTMTSVLRRLERTGWVERRPSDEDLRSFTIQATGVERLTELYRPAHERFAAGVEEWTPQQRDELVAFLESAAQGVRRAGDELRGDR